MLVTNRKVDIMTLYRKMLHSFVKSSPNTAARLHRAENLSSNKSSICSIISLYVVKCWNRCRSYHVNEMLNLQLRVLSQFQRYY